MATPSVHYLPVTRTARYFTLGDPATARYVWYVLHGYSQLAATFISYFATLDDGSRLVVAPEGLSRFYLDQGRGPPGASWMTREDRDHEIADYVRYLDQLNTDIRARTPSATHSFLLGFSQGVATAGRWLDRGSARHEGFCFWAGTLPQELELGGPHPALQGKKVALAVGHKDEFLTAEWLETESRRLAPAAGEVRQFPFHGGHRLDRTVLARVAGFFEAPAS